MKFKVLESTIYNNIQYMADTLDSLSQIFHKITAQYMTNELNQIRKLIEFFN